jgi:VWFA-related protein
MFVAVVSAVRGQSPASPPVLRSSTQLVVLDVVVQDQDGHPVRGLATQNFRVSEGGVAQMIGHVEEHSAQTAHAVVASPPEPPGIFTDYTPVDPNGTLNILLIDALNTPVKDQAFVRYELQQYVKRANPNTRIAVFGLANRLILLQGFTSDPAVLRGVVERKLIARSSSSLLPSDGETVTDQQRASDLSDQVLSVAAPSSNGSPSALDLAANLREFQSELGAMETQLRAHYTLDAFNTLAHYLAGFPGRKNLIWFSGSFPLNILPDPTSARPSEISTLDQTEFREMVNLFTKAEVAVYPIDARGLMTQPTFSAATPGSTVHANQVRRFDADLNKFSQTEAAEHAMMEDLATGTGGRAFYNTNNLAAAVSSAIAAGADYYTLSYTPTNAKEDGAYRPIRVEASGVDPTRKLELFYRRGYYANDASVPPKPTEKPDPFAPTPEEGRALAYKHAAMSRGGPTPEDILFKVRVVPTSAATDTVPAPDNELSLSVPANGPFRRFDIDYISLSGELSFTEQPDGHRAAKAEFMAYVYDTEGRLLNATGKTVSIEAKTTDVAKLMRGIVRCHLELSVPDRAETFLRIGMRDVETNRFGVIEVPASSLSSLPPATDEAAPPSGRPTPPKD